ncbi:MAG: hypothetical protein J7647_21375 [Cyanobacteria bacterium SBLK]|nr:hypothetical protein [Cyanobacteria bacterium SBLK]
MFNNTTLLLILSFVAIFPFQKANAIDTDAIVATQNPVEFSTLDSPANTEPNCDRGSGRLHCYKTETQQFNKERGSGRINTEEQTYKKSLHR